RRREAAVLDRTGGGAAVRFGDPGAARLPRSAAPGEPRGARAVSRARLRPRHTYDVRRDPQARARTLTARRRERCGAAAVLDSRGRRARTLAAHGRRAAARHAAPRGGARADVR